MLGMTARLVFFIGIIHEEMLRPLLESLYVTAHIQKLTHRGQEVAVLFRVQLVVPAMANFELSVGATFVDALWRVDRMSRAEVTSSTHQPRPPRLRAH